MLSVLRHCARAAATPLSAAARGYGLRRLVSLSSLVCKTHPPSGVLTWPTVGLPQDGPTILGEVIQLDSVLRKRRKKMKKHKLRKRRKREKAERLKLSQGR
ncbi:mitochondrial 37S ribosomal protein mS38 QRI5 KNAG_0B02635 [Huiozyma naganishii CBS 8797]|uniref:Ribosomal protein mS38 C-terminal domain-containing protein n=1 Tax=Huiozyma naganishii (strain ATCC MYA-139 / BCRC 22969 / CBS 8797 / KCTC 17520 / NBRC 10181 / NCYC 3082 / Yp74L-3) TaxID=1071383 RepID=J7S4P5_HUIN7|nr:hypothetical protein KNAG_0B02635 [Kazachstania naganishii CBS 8797]CCK68706.1 hypothetical protein KNAG_0B02635 [Kazachstania naganishii CBS 8797]